MGGALFNELAKVLRWSSYAALVLAPAVSQRVQLLQASFPCAGPWVNLTLHDGAYVIHDETGQGYTFNEIEVTTSTVVERRTPGWAIILLVLLFPIGLLFLLVKENRLRPVYTISLRASGGGWAQLASPFPIVEVPRSPPPASPYPPPVLG